MHRPSIRKPHVLVQHRPEPTYYIVELQYSTRMRYIGQESCLKQAQKQAYDHSYRTGRRIEIQDDSGKTVDSICVWRES